MKQILTIIIISSSLLGVSQNTSGIITYKETTNFQIDMADLEEQGIADFAAKLPSSSSHKAQLVFTPEATLYSNLKEPKKEDNSEVQMIVMFSNPDNKTYIDYSKNKVIEQQDFMGKMFLVNGELEKLNWKISGETKIVLNYPCIKATITDSIETLEAWFTTEIPISIGPEKYGNLPGVILELSSKMTRKTITASDIKFQKILASDMEIPSEGKKVSKAKYEKIVESKIKEMQLEFGGSHSGDGNTTIKVIRQ